MAWAIRGLQLNGHDDRVGVVIPLVPLVSLDSGASTAHQNNESNSLIDVEQQ